jgi:hypothetical protein
MKLGIILEESTIFIPIILIFGVILLIKLHTYVRLERRVDKLLSLITIQFYLLNLSLVLGIV